MRDVFDYADFWLKSREPRAECRDAEGQGSGEAGNGPEKG
jgi:hypothetical protein